MSIRETIARNTFYNVLGRAAEGVLGFVLVYYVVKLRLGSEGWGLWSLVAVFTGYASLFDFGIASGFVKYIAEYAARKEAGGLSAVVSTGVLFYTVFAVILVAAGWPAVDLLMDHVILPRALAEGAAPPAYAADMRFLFHGALILYALNTCFGPLSAIPTGLQRMGITNALSAAASVLKLCAVIGFIENGFGVRGLLWAALVVSLFQGVGSVIVARWLVPGLRVSPALADRKAFRELFSFGWRSQVAKLSNLINFQTDRVVVAFVSSFGNMGLVGLYGLGEFFAAKMRQGPALIVSALVPAASDLDARNEEDHLRTLYLRSTKYMAALAVPVCLFSATAAGVIMRAWFGDLDGIETAAMVLRILSIGYLANLLPGPGVSIVLGKGRADLPMYAGLISMAANIAATLALWYAIGFYGIPLATTLGMILSTGWFFLRMRGIVKISLRSLLRQSMLWPCLACVPGMLGCGVVEFLIPGNWGQLIYLALAGAGAAVFGLVYLAVIRLSPFLDDYDIDFLEHTLRLGAVPGFRRLTGKRSHV